MIKSELIELPVLDHGFVRLVDKMGDDKRIEETARISYQEGTRKISDTATLIRYLLRHKHTSPFEKVVFEFHVKAPDVTIWQWVRHRTGSFNIESARYSIMSEEFYLPDGRALGEQSKSNKQGRIEGNLSIDEIEQVQTLFERAAHDQQALYEYMLNEEGDEGRPQLARELSRMVRGFNFYREFNWTVNLWNLMHFLELRDDPHAQYEIRVYAQAISQIVRNIVPIAYEAYEDYIKNALTLTALEVEALQMALAGLELSEQGLLMGFDSQNKRETQEFLAKLKRIGIEVK